MNFRAVIKRIVVQEIRTLVVEVIRTSIIKDPEPVTARKRSVFYKGDSWAKKSARLRIWEAVQEAMGRKKFRAGPHLFLASHEGGDASVLQAMDVPFRSMIAVEWNEEEAAEFSASYPDVRTEIHDVSSVLASERSLASVHLDFTSQVTEHCISRVVLATKKVISGGVIACAFAIGREKSFQKGDGESTYGSRLKIVTDRIQQSVGYRPKVLLQFQYRSDSIYGPGTNMCAIAVQMTPSADPYPQLQTLSVYDFYRDVERHISSRSLNLLLNCSQSKTESLRSRIMAYPPPRA